MQRRVTFPPAGIVVVRRDLHEAELLVVIRADPFGGIDGALLERRIDVATGDLLRHHAELGHDVAGEARDAHLQALEVVDRLDLLAEPAAHLRRRVAADHADDVVALEEVVEQLLAAALGQPRIHLPRVEAERNDGRQREGRVLAEEVVAGGLAHLDRAVLHRVEHLQARDDLARREGADLELVVGRLGHDLGEVLDAAVQRVERLGEARGQAPVELGRGLGDGGRRDRAGGRRGGGADTGGAEEFATLHEETPGSSMKIARLMTRDPGRQKPQRMSNRTSANAPTAMRYQANTPKPWRLTKRTNGFTTTRADRNAADEADRDQPAAMPVQRLPVLVEVVDRRPEHGRDGEEEGELGRSRTVHAQNARSHDRGARARDAGDHGQALAETDEQRGLPVDVVDRLDARTLRDSAR